MIDLTIQEAKNLCIILNKKYGLNKKYALNYTVKYCIKVFTNYIYPENMWFCNDPTIMEKCNNK